MIIRKIAGCESHAEEYGESGSPVVLLHGWGCRGAMMKSAAEALAGTHRVLAVDFPGFGDSGMPPEPWGVPEYAAWLKEMIREAGWRPYKDIGIVFTGVRPGEKIEEELGLETGVRIDGTKIFACGGEET